jgi:chromosome segregation ATPase
LEWVGQTTNLRRVPNVTILRAKLEMDEIRILRKLEKSNASALARREFVMSCRKRLEDEIAHFQAIKAEYNTLKNQKLDQIGDQWHHLQEKLEVLKRELQRARENVRGAISEWSRLCGQFGLPKNHLAFWWGKL